MVSCQNKAEVDRAVHVFFTGVLQVLNMLVFGVIGLVFSIISHGNGKQGHKVVGGITSGLFALFTVMTFLAVQSYQPRHGTIYILYLFSFVMLGVAAFFLFRTPAQNATPIQKGNDKGPSLDDIINGDDEDEII